MMKQDNLETILQNLREEHLPPCPANLREQILRRIRLETKSPVDPLESFWIGIFRLALRPSMAIGLVALAMILGAVTTTVASQQSAPPPKSAKILGFEIIADPHLLECHHRIQSLDLHK